MPLLVVIYCGVIVVNVALYIKISNIIEEIIGTKLIIEKSCVPTDTTELLLTEKERL